MDKSNSNQRKQSKLYRDNFGATFRSAEEEELLSTCCGAEPYDDTDICSDCREHADFEAWEDD